MGAFTYAQYCTRRGYAPPFKGWSVIRRSLFGSWAQPGFHRFWRVWNPPIGYPLFRLYRILGGNRHRVLATVVVFTMCGFLHDMAVLLLVRRWSLMLTAAFLAFASLTLLSLKLEPILKQARWPSILNVLLNLALVGGTIYASIWLARRLAV